jgi:hypothetical protein
VRGRAIVSVGHTLIYIPACFAVTSEPFVAHAPITTCRIAAKTVRRTKRAAGTAFIDVTASKALRPVVKTE